MSQSKESFLKDKLAELTLIIDVRRELGFRLFNKSADAGIYIAGSLLWADNVPAFPLDGKVRFDKQMEYGISLGTNPRSKVMFIRLPRFSIGYRTGKNFRGIRITLGDRELRLPPKN